jgi:hypothetical protein
MVDRLLTPAFPRAWAGAAPRVAGPSHTAMPDEVNIPTNAGGTRRHARHAGRPRDAGAGHLREHTPCRPQDLGCPNEARRQGPRRRRPEAHGRLSPSQPPVAEAASSRPAWLRGQARSPRKARRSACRSTKCWRSWAKYRAPTVDRATAEERARRPADRAVAGLWRVPTGHIRPSPAGAVAVRRRRQARKALLRRSSPSVLIGPWPQMKTTS